MQTFGEGGTRIVTLSHTSVLAAGGLALFLTLFVLMAAASASAATRTWTGNSINVTGAPHNNLWGNPFNWDSGTPAAGDDLVFPANAPQTTSVNDIGGPPSFNTLTVTGHTMAGAPLALNAGLSATASAITLSSIKLNNDQTFSSPVANVGSTITSSIDTNGKHLTLDGAGTLTLTGVISGTGRLTKQGTGVGQLNGPNTYTGLTRSAQGNLLVFGLQPASVVDLEGGNLGGAGTVGTVTVRTAPAAIDPGTINHGTGTLTVNGNVSFGSSGTGRGLVVDLNGTEAASGYDLLRVNSGMVNLTNGELTVVTGSNFTPPPGATFTIIKNESVNPIQGFFTGKPEGTIFGAGSAVFRISYAGGDGNDVTLTVFTGTVAFTGPSFTVNEGSGAANIALFRSGIVNGTAVAKVILASGTASPADYRFTPGALDATFDPGAGANHFVFASAVQADGKIIISGFFNSYNGTTRNRVARLNPNGSLDASFDPGAGANDVVRSLALQTDGKIIAGGWFTSYNGNAVGGIVRLNGDGSPDPAFNPGTGTNSLVDMVARQSDGKIIVVGDFTAFNGTARNHIARLNTNGSLDNTFDPGTGADGEVFATALQSDSKIIIGGRFTAYNGTPLRGIARVNTNGSRDATFDPGTGLGAGEDVFAINVQVDGKIIIAGGFTSYNGTPRSSIARLNPDGSLDPTFNPGGNVVRLFASALQPDGKIIVGGDLNINGSSLTGVARLNENGSLDAAFNLGTGIDSGSSGVFDLTLQGDGKIIIHGDFLSYNGTNRSNVARLAGDLFATWGPGDTSIRTIPLPIVDDALIEGNETLNLTLVPLSGAMAVAPSSATLTIIDNDPGATPTPTPTPGVTPTPTPGITPTPPPGVTPTPTPGITPTPTPGITPAPTSTPGPSPAQALNISTRMRVEAGNNVLIGGFIITGNAAKNVAVRGIGPSLSAFGISDALADPTLELRGAGGLLIFDNDNWQDNASQAAQLSALGLGLSDPKESGIAASLQPGAYTAILAGKNSGTGIGLVEIYDTNSGADAHLANISTRGFVLTGNNVMIGGFILGGNSNTRVVVRGIGPSLAQFGLNPVLADPTLELHDGNGATLVSNDNWQDDSASAAQLSLLGLAPSDLKEAGIFASVPPGAFTAVLAGKNGGTGIGLVEVYNVH